MSIFMHILNFQKNLIKYRIKRAIRKPKVMKHEDWKLRRQQNEEDAYRHIELYDKQPSFEDNTKIAHSYSIGTLIIYFCIWLINISIAFEIVLLNVYL